jgi:hypothetical protein
MHLLVFHAYTNEMHISRSKKKTLILFLIVIYRRLELPFGLNVIVIDRLNSGIASSNPASLFYVLCFLYGYTCRLLSG